MLTLKIARSVIFPATPTIGRHFLELASNGYNSINKISITSHDPQKREYGHGLKLEILKGPSPYFVAVSKKLF
jgi:hypothetical protein